MTRLARVLLLVLMWLALWGQVSLGNLVGGLLVAGVVTTLFPMPRRTRRTADLTIHPLPALRFLLWFTGRLVMANVVVARLVITGQAVSPGIVRVPLRTRSEGIATIVMNAITLTPGTLTIDIDRERAEVVIHALQAQDVAEAARDVAELERRALEAFGGPAALADPTEEVQR